MKLTMTRFHFSAPNKVVSKYLSTKDNLSNYISIILIGGIVLLLGIYSFLAYSFLETSSSLLIEDYPYQVDVTINQKNKQANQLFSLQFRTIDGNTLKNNESTNSFIIISTFFENHLVQTPKYYSLSKSRLILYISKNITNTDSLEYVQKKNITVS